MSATGAAQGAGYETGFGSKGYRSFVLGSLLLAYIFNFIDRVIISYLSVPIIDEFKIEYWQFGILSGFAFAFFYTLLGIPLARLAERFNRTIIIGVSIIFWSVMTALCGLATSFATLLIFRFGVSIGEAGLTPPANSLISDYFKPSSRSAAIALYSTGVTIGSFFAALFVALFIGMVTWRETFIIVGLAGVPIGLIILFLVKEPPRGYTDPPGTVRPEVPGIGETLKALAGNKTFWHVTLGGMAASFVGYGLVTFVMEFLRRSHGLDVQDAALYFLAPLALVGAVGTWLSGFLATRFGGRSAVWLPAIALPLAMIFQIWGLNASNIYFVFVLLVIANLFQYFYLGPMYSVAGAVVDAKMRATAIAILLFVVNLIGYGLGPLVTGVFIDWMISFQLSGVDGLDRVTCFGGEAVLTPEQTATCAEARGQGVRHGMSIVVLLFLWGAAHFYFAMRTVNEDLVSK